LKLDPVWDIGVHSPFSTFGTIVDRPYILLNFVNDIVSDEHFAPNGRTMLWRRDPKINMKQYLRPCRKGRHSDCSGLPCECAKNEHEVA